jgi:FtsZ-binding cell division protein ZapB
MSGETERDVSGWTTDTLHTHLQRQLNDLIGQIQRQIDDMQKQLERRFEAERHAVDLAFEAHRALTNATGVATDKAVQAALAAQKEAVQVAQDAARETSQVLARNAEQYRAQQNEWREAMRDILNRAMTRDEAKGAIDRATERIQELMTAQQNAPTRDEIQAMRERVGALEKGQVEIAAKTAGAQTGRASIFTAITAAVALITMVIIVANAWTR